MVEYGVNVANKFGFLSDDEADDPESMLRRAEAVKRKDEKGVSQKKAEKNAAARRRKEMAPNTAGARTASREAEVGKVPQATPPAKRNDSNKENKENRPEGERGRGRGRGRGGFGGRGGRGAGGGAHFGTFGIPQRVDTDENNDQRDVMADRFGETRGRGRGRGGRGRPPFSRGGRGGSRPFQADQESPLDDSQPTDNVAQDGDQLDTERQNLTDFGVYRGSFRGRGGFRNVDRDRDNFRTGDRDSFRTGDRDSFRTGDRDSFRTFGDRDNERPFYRGGRGGRGGRQYDRISGSDRTGIKPFDKKDGFGRGNWGTEQDELTGQNESLNSNVEALEKVEEPAPPREKTEEELKREAEEEALSKQLTLDEFKAQMAAKRSEPVFNIRRANEGSNDKEFAKLIPLPKREFEELTEEEIVVVRREPRTKRLDIEINFTDEQRGGRGGRGRDGFRGRGGRRGEGRGPRQATSFDMTPEAFPVLGSQ